MVRFPAHRPACPPMTRRCLRLPLSILTLCCALAAAALAAPETAPPAGLRENTPDVYALINARIVPAPGQSIERGTLVVRRGVIEALGPLEPAVVNRQFHLLG